MLDKTSKKNLKATSEGEAGKPQTLVISPPNFQRATVRITGLTPYVMNKMSS